MSISFDICKYSRDELLKQHKIACITCKHIDPDHNICQINRNNGNFCFSSRFDMKTKKIDGVLWTYRYANSYTYWEKHEKALLLLEDNLFEM